MVARLPRTKVQIIILYSKTEVISLSNDTSSTLVQRYKIRDDVTTIENKNELSIDDY